MEQIAWPSDAVQYTVQYTLDCNHLRGGLENGVGTDDEYDDDASGTVENSESGRPKRCGLVDGPGARFAGCCDGCWMLDDVLGPVAVWLSSCDCLAASEASRFSLSSVSLSRKSTHRSANDCT